MCPAFCPCCYRTREQYFSVNIDSSIFRSEKHLVLSGTTRKAKSYIFIKKTSILHFNKLLNSLYFYERILTFRLHSQNLKWFQTRKIVATLEKKALNLLKNTWLHSTQFHKHSFCRSPWYGAGSIISQTQQFDFLSILCPSFPPARPLHSWVARILLLFAFIFFLIVKIQFVNIRPVFSDK